MQHPFIKYVFRILLTGLFLFNSHVIMGQDGLFDDFNDPQRSDSLWSKADRTWSAGDPENPLHGGVIPDLVSYGDGKMIIRGHGLLYDGPIEGHGRNTRVGGAVISKKRFASGSYEFRARILPREGALSAFWTFYFSPYSSIDSGNVNHEIDIEVKMEDGRFDQAYCNTWIYEKVYTHRINNAFYNQDDGNFHLYRFDWHTGGEGTDPRVEFYFDDTLREVINTHVPYIASNLWIGVWFPGWAGEPLFDVDSMIVDWVRITPFNEPNDSTDEVNLERRPFNDHAAVIPGLIEAEEFDVGNNGDSYFDTDAGNTGRAFRTSTDVDIEEWHDSLYAVGYIEKGEWLEYTVNVLESGPYHVILSAASSAGGGLCFLEMNGTRITDTVNIPKTGGWGQFMDVSVNNLSLEEGEQILRLFVVEGGFNLDYLNFSSGSKINESPVLPEQSSLKLFPNPAEPDRPLYFTASGVTGGEALLDVFGINGEKVYSDTFAWYHNADPVQLINFPRTRGTYIAILQTSPMPVSDILIVK
jgi:hypothetical protein